MSFVIGQIINTESQAIPTTPVKPLGAGNIYETERGELEANSQKIVFATPSPTIIEYLEWATDSYSNGVFMIDYYNGENYAQIGMLTQNGSGSTGFSAASIDIHGTNLFDILAFDKESNNFKFGLRKNLSFPLGLRVRVQNTGSQTINIAARAYAREMQ